MSRVNPAAGTAGMTSCLYLIPNIKLMISIVAPSPFFFNLSVLFIASTPCQPDCCNTAPQIRKTLSPTVPSQTKLDPEGEGEWRGAETDGLYLCQPPTLKS